MPRRPIAPALKRGDLDALETAIRFREAGPMFFRSGQVKAGLLRVVKRMPPADLQRERLRRVTLEEPATGLDAKIARRAKWMPPYVARTPCAIARNAQK
jgi:hypothetical protein